MQYSKHNKMHPQDPKKSLCLPSCLFFSLILSLSHVLFLDLAYSSKGQYLSLGYWEVVEAFDVGSSWRRVHWGVFKGVCEV